MNRGWPASSCPRGEHRFRRAQSFLAVKRRAMPGRILSDFLESDFLESLLQALAIAVSCNLRPTWALFEYGKWGLTLSHSCMYVCCAWCGHTPESHKSSIAHFTHQCIITSVAFFGNRSISRNRRRRFLQIAANWEKFRAGCSQGGRLRGVEGGRVSVD